MVAAKNTYFSNGKKWFSKATWMNIPLLFAKQHAFCHGLLPLAAFVGGDRVARALDKPFVEAAVYTVLPPVITFGTMLAEQAWENRKAVKRTHEPRKTLTLRNYFKETAIAYGISALTFGATHFAFPHHHHKESEQSHRMEIATPVLKLSQNRTQNALHFY